MLGLVIGAACVIGLAKMLRRRAWYARFGYGGCGAGGCGPSGYGPGGCDARGYGPFGHGGGGPVGFRNRGGRWMLRSLFERLETTPGQERVILAALDEMRENRKVLREELQQSRADLARALEGGLIEDATLEESFARQDRMLARLRVGFVEALKKITEALDEPQRKQLASWIEGGFFRSRWGGPGSVWA